MGRGEERQDGEKMGHVDGEEQRDGMERDGEEVYKRGRRGGEMGMSHTVCIETRQ